jgi:hypothetical protein
MGGSWNVDRFRDEKNGRELTPETGAPLEARGNPV